MNSIEMRKKANFVEELFEFYKQTVNKDSDIQNMFYQNEGSAEWVYVSYGSGEQSRFSVTHDNNRAIVKDFNRFLCNC